MVIFGNLNQSKSAQKASKNTISFYPIPAKHIKKSELCQGVRYSSTARHHFGEQLKNNPRKKIRG